jgi:DNA-binding response OmpR family regulator
MGTMRDLGTAAGGVATELECDEHMKTKILIVEDDPHILLGLEEILKGEGFEVTVCNRGDKALDAVTKAKPSLIVLDLMLPGASGYDVCKQLRAKKVAARSMLTARAGDGQGHRSGSRRRRLS